MNLVNFEGFKSNLEVAIGSTIPGGYIMKLQLLGVDIDNDVAEIDGL